MCVFNNGERKKGEEEEVRVVGKESGKSHYYREGSGWLWCLKSHPDTVLQL